MRPALQTLRYVLAHIRPRDLDNKTELILILNDALAVHLGSPSLSAQCCELLSTILTLRPDFVHAVSLDLALTRARDVIGTHFSTEAQTVDAALKLIGTIVLALAVPLPISKLRSVQSALPKKLTAALTNAHILHWVVVSLRQWRAVASVQTHALRALAASATVSREIKFNLVMSHAIFHELVVSLSELSEDPRLLAHVCETLCVFLNCSAEFRRLSVVDRVPHALLKHAKPHMDCPRVAAAVTSVFAIYAHDPEVLPIIMTIRVVPFVADALCTIQTSPSLPRRSRQRPAAYTPTHRRHRTSNVRERVNNDRKLEEPFATTTSAADAMSKLLELLAMLVRESPCSANSLTSRRCMNASVAITTAYESEIAIVRAGLQLFCALCGAEDAHLKQAGRSRAITSTVLGVKVEPAVPSHVPEMVISLACAALHSHLKSADVVRLACLVLLNVCHRGFRRSVLRKSPTLPSVVEQALQMFHDQDDIVIPAGALRMVLL